MPIYRTLVDLISEKSLTDHCIVLDIDNTLLFSSEDNSWIKKLNVFRNPKLIGIRNRVYISEMVDVVTPIGKGEVTKMSGILRNDAREFMAFCFHYFKVVTIWSAEKKKYVHEMAKILCQDLNYQPHLIFSYYQCLMEKVKVGDVLYEELYKPLSIMYNVPTLEGLMRDKNTFVLDDRESTFGKNKGNGILIPVFAPDFTISGLTKNDNALRQLMHWFSTEEVRKSRDVTKLDKSEIFKLKITEPVESVLIEETIQPTNIDLVNLIEYHNPEVIEILNDKNYNIRRSTQKNGYLGMKFLSN